MTRAYYNDNDPAKAAWLRELIKRAEIAPGDVDDRDIRLIRAGDLDGYDQHHFFAGIGGWSHALRLAGWPDDAPVWSASCPCQPFSTAGKGLGTKDARHLWPQLRRLYRQRRPATLFGEQVASEAGRYWLSGVFADLEALGSRAAAADLCAAGEGAPHARQRLYFVADPHRHGWQPRRQRRTPLGHRQAAEPDRRTCCLGHSEGTGLPACDGEALSRSRRGVEGRRPEQSGATFWSDAEWIECRDGRRRAIEPGSFPLAHGVFGRVGLLRGYGDAIVPQVAARFIGAYMSLMR